MPSYSVATPEYNPSTAVAIALSKFDKEAKNIAEAEYDEEHGLLPERPDPADCSLDIAEREILKKKRKVRSAIVSRRKSAIYVERVEADLKMRDNINLELRSHIDISREVLRNTTERIQALEEVLERKKHVQAPKRTRSTEFFRSEIFEQSPSHTIDDILSVSPDDFSHSQTLPPAMASDERRSEALSEHDFESECSDRQSPLSFANVGFDQSVPMQKTLFRNDPWKGHLIAQQAPTTRAI